MLLLQMKKLILIRHAAAEEYLEETVDFDRNLTVPGKKEAAKMAAFLLSKGSNPQVIISSPALRAITTANVFTASLSLDNPKVQPSIYEADVNALLQVIYQINAQIEVAALVGHNPGVSNLLYFLTGEIITMATSSWVEIALEAATWTEVSSNTGKLMHYRFP